MKLKPFALDVLLLTLLVPAQAKLGGTPYLLVVPFLFYVLLEVWHPLAKYNEYPKNVTSARLAFLLRLSLIFIMISSAVIIPSLTRVVERSRVEIDDSNYDKVYQETHDGAIQVEYALQFFDEGKNPYVESYRDTELAYYSFSGIESFVNSALDYFVYLPGLLIGSFPFYKLATVLGLYYDQRVIYLLLYILLLFLLPALVKPPVLKLALLAGIALNPLLTGPVIHGMNDIVIVFAIFLIVLFLSKRKIMLSALVIGLAFTVKQSAWFIFPFYILYVYQIIPAVDRKKYLLRIFLLWCLLGMLLVLPFVLWSFSDFVTDVFAYPGGAVDLNYPIRGFTLGTLLVGSGYISSPTDSFPFVILQVLFGLPLLFFLLYKQYKDNNLGNMLLYSGVFIFGLGFLSRFFQTNYVGFVTVLLTAGILLASYLPREEVVLEKSL